MKDPEKRLREFQLPEPSPEFEARMDRLFAESRGHSFAARRRFSMRQFGFAVAGVAVAAFALGAYLGASITPNEGAGNPQFIASPAPPAETSRTSEERTAVSSPASQNAGRTFATFPPGIARRFQEVARRYEESRRGQEMVHAKRTTETSAKSADIESLVERAGRGRVTPWPLSERRG
jgi:hypothetical protein